MKKYELVETYKTTPFGNPLFQVVALRDFGDVRKGDLGGYIESTHNLSNRGRSVASTSLVNPLVLANPFVGGHRFTSQPRP